MAAPTVVTTVPADAETNVYVNKPITVTFSEAVDADSITNNTVPNIELTTAMVTGTLWSSNTVFDVYVYYGTNDGGTVAGAWGANAFVGSYTNVNEFALSKTITGLVADNYHSL